MDELGVHAKVLYANVMGFAGQGRGEAQSKALPPLDPELRLISTQIFNDAMGEMQAESGKRLGASDASMSWYGDTPWPSQTPANKLSIGGTMMFISNARVVCNIIASGMLDRFPRLKFVSVESGIGWLPFVLEALQYQMDTSSSHRYELTAKEYFRRQLYGCFWFENDDGVDSMRKLGIDNVLFETDFPHPTCLYPDPFGKVASTLSAMTDEERRKVLSLNAAKLYNIAV